MISYLKNLWAIWFGRNETTEQRVPEILIADVQWQTPSTEQALSDAEYDACQHEWCHAGWKTVNGVDVPIRQCIRCMSLERTDDRSSK